MTPAGERRRVRIVFSSGNSELNGDLNLPMDNDAALRVLREADVLRLRPGHLLHLEGAGYYVLTPEGWEPAG